MEQYKKDLQNNNQLITEASKVDLLKRKLNKVFMKYKLQVITDKDGKKRPDVLGKREGDYNVIIKVDSIQNGMFMGPSVLLKVYVTDAETNEPIEGYPPYTEIKIKSKHDTDDISEAINDVLSDYHIELTGSNNKIQSPQTFAGGITAKKILDRFKNSGLSNNEQRQILKNCINAWNKLNDTELKQLKQLFDMK